MWQPIETAPKDGTIVDLWHKKAGRLTETWWDTDCWVCTLGGDDEFSHWMHVPKPPGNQTAPELTTEDIQYMIDYLERTLSLFESEDSRQCYHMGLVKLKLHISILKQLLEDE